ncbi:YbbR-like domain-containing protein [uncultured Polaribacter sp.]|jgi:hypothetical protein|uniref:YbbR-like domain-containing protein n=1 Tax=uncultured Polaribacter sp. TaxID=174711 RepID=UPI002606BBEE|nr:YbbR-like domain-containing protein [uncultured Polaribacter sp.]
MGFLIASVLIWMLITLSKEYTATLRFPLKYSDFPQDKLLQKEPLSEIDVIVKSSGFNILKSRLSDKNLVFNAKSLNKKSSSQYYFLTRNQFKSVQKQLQSGVQLQEISLDTIFLDLGSLISKKVPLKPNLEINYHIGYDILESVSMDPDSILISGPKGQIENIKIINLELLKLEDVKSDFSKNVKIILPENTGNIKLNSKFTKISGEVEKFTEGTFKISFKVLNLPKDINLTTLNKTIEVVFVVALSNFDKVNKDFFEVVCDYNIAKENKLNYLIPKVTVNSRLIKSFKVIPNKIDFLIQK